MIVDNKVVLTLSYKQYSTLLAWLTQDNVNDYIIPKQRQLLDDITIQGKMETASK